MNNHITQSIVGIKKRRKIFHPFFKLTLLTLLLSLTLQSVKAQSGNTISLNFKHEQLTTVLKSIKSQSGFVFVTGDLDLKKYYIDVQIKNVSIGQALAACLHSHGLLFTIVNKTIVISKDSENSTKILGASFTRTYELRGVVRAEDDGAALPGATVLVKGSTNGVLVKSDGTFNLQGVTASDVVVISFIGYEKLEVPVVGRSNIGTVVLSQKTNKLDEVEVLAYGLTTSNRYATGSSVKITSKDISKQPVENVMQALQGKVAGLIINQSSGLHGADIDVEIRGQNSLDPSNSTTNVLKNVPLYVVDGIAFPGAAINQLASSKSTSGSYFYLQGPNGSGNGSPLATISPSDIESIEILKDANATALYGSRGANGVILIKTKKGNVGKPVVSINLSSGVSIMNTSMQALNLTDYLALRKEAFANDNKTPTTTNAPDLTLWSQTEGQNFKKILIGSPSKSYSGGVSVSGGGHGSTFMLSGNYSRNTSVFDDNRSSSSYGLHFSSGYTSPDEKFKATLSIIMGSNISNLASAGFYQYAYSLPPNFPLRNTDGSLYWWSKSIPNISNPLAALNSSYQNNMNTLNTSINLSYALTRKLKLSVNAGYNRTQSNQSDLSPSTSANPESTSLVSTRTATYTESNARNLVIEPQLNYSALLGGGNLTALLGATYQETVNEQPFFIIASGFSSDLYMKDLSMASSYIIHNGYSAYKYVSFFGNVNYIYKERYIINGNFRRDGSSKFGPNNLYANFGSVGLAWIFTSEPFLTRKPEWFSFGKIRSSYGVVGNDNVQNYAYLSSYSGTSSSYYSGASGLSPARVANPNYKWATTRKFEIATDLGFFKDRLLFNFAYFSNRTSNQLLDYPLSTQTGFSSYTANLNALVQNTGLEVTLTSTNIRTKNFTWSTSANASLPQNKLLSFPGLASSSYASTYVVGRPTTSLYLLHYTGTDKDGMPTYQDVDKDGKITTTIGANTGVGDLVYEGKSYPDLYGGLSNTFKYKNFQLDISARFTLGAKDLGILSTLSSAPGTLSNFPSAVVQAMRALGVQKLFTTSSYSTAFKLFQQSDAMLQKLSYGRLTNVSFSYNLPENLSKRIKLSNMRFYIQGQNLFKFTLSGKTYAGIDPETGTSAVPPLTAIVGGIQFSL
ncbi:MAG: TonB-dependent receptor [Bacteroidetes bacterium]|nr:TonB-dependent receptor [Bacteroidota bacterium]